MRRLLALALIGSFAAATAQLACGAETDELIIRTSDGSDVYVAVCLPTGDGPFPAVLVIHGGAGGNRQATKSMASPESSIPLVREFIKRKWVVLSTDYRAGAVFGKEEDDVVAAFQYLRNHPRVDRDQVACWGGSHGGHLALRIAERFSQDLACVAVGSPWLPDPISYLYGDPEQEPLANYSQATLRFLLKRRQQLLSDLPLTTGTTREVHPQQLHERSILENAHKITCPTLFVTSHGDEIVPHVMVEPVIRKAQEENEQVRVFTAQDAGHGFYHRAVEGEEHSRARATVLAFFDAHLSGESKRRASDANSTAKQPARAPSANRVGSAAWFGIPIPQERQRLRETQLQLGKLVDLDVPALPLTLSEEEDPYRDISGEALQDYIRELVRFSHLSRDNGEILWGRNMGSKWTNMAADYMAEQFRNSGAHKVWSEPVPCRPQWWPTDAGLMLLGDPAFGNGTQDYNFTSAMPAAPSRSAGLEAELIYVGNGRPADLIGRDIKGRIAVMRSRPNPSVLFHTGRGAPFDLFERGAVGVVTIVDFPGNHQSVPPFSSESDRGPTFTIGGDDGDFLEEVLARAGSENRPRMRIKLAVTTRRGLEAKSVYALIEGETDEYVIAIAHLDGHFEGAIDNASGLATLLGWTKHFSNAKHKPKRNLLLVATAGHHSGAAATRLLVRNHPEIISKTALLINCEHTASRAVRRTTNFLIPFIRGGDPELTRLRHSDLLVDTNTENPRSLSVSNRNEALTSIAREAISRYGLVVSTRTDHKVRGDAGPLVRLAPEMPVLNFIEGGYWYHTTADTVAAVSASGLERTARAFAMVIDEVNRLPREALGDQVSERPKPPQLSAPQVEGRPFTITAIAESEHPQGVVVSHGGVLFGYSLHILNGRAAFSIRNDGRLTELVAERPLKIRKRVELKAVLDAKTMSISIDGQVVATQPSPGLLARQPAIGFHVGQDVQDAVGSYEVPNALTGTVHSYSVQVE